MAELAPLAPAAGNAPRLFLVLFAATLAVQFARHFRDQVRFFATSPARVYGEPPRLLGRFRLPALGRAQFLTAGLVFFAALLGAALGRTPRPFLLAALAGYLFHFSQVLGLDFVQRKTNPLPLVLLILVCSPGLERPWGQAAPWWPLWLVQAVLAQMYFSSGWQKIRRSGWGWSDGRTLQAALLDHHLWSDNHAALALAGRPRTCRALSRATLAFELSFPAILLVPGLSYPYALAGLLFHAGTAYALRIRFLEYLGPVYTVFLVEPVLCLLRSAGWIVPAA